MHAGESRDGGRPFARGPWGLVLIGGGWLAMLIAESGQAQTPPILPDPLPPTDEVGAPPAPSGDPFASPEMEQGPSQPGLPAGELKPGQAQAQAPGQDLTASYLLIESYTEAVDGDKGTADGRLSEYQVAFRETVTETNDNPQGSPDKQVVTRQARFTERPIEVGPGDDRMVSALLRRYEGARVDPNPWAKTSHAPLMDDLTIWYESLPGAPARVLTLNPGRSLLEQECQFARGNPLVSDFAYILPEFPVQILDDWPVDRRGVSALLSTPVAQAEVSAKLADIRPAEDAQNGEQIAVIDLAGRAATQQGMTQINAQVEFAFLPSPPGGADGPIEVRGGITKVRLAQATTIPRQGADGPLGGTVRRSLVLQRRWPGEGPPVQGPKTAPEATPENSWLTFVDLDGRFTVRYPQEYTHDYRFGAQNVVALMKASGPAAGQPDSIFLAFFEDQQPRADTVFPSFFEKHRQGGFQVRSTEPTQLPEDQWPGAEVQRVEAALTPDPRLTTTSTGEAQLPRRLHFDGYLLRFTRNAALTAEAITAQDASTAFRDEVEAVLKTFRLGPPASESPKP